MPRFSVTLYFDGVIFDEVDAENSGEAEQIAMEEAYESLQATRVCESFRFTGAQVDEVEDEDAKAEGGD